MLRVSTVHRASTSFCAGGNNRMVHILIIFNEWIHLKIKTKKKGRVRNAHLFICPQRIKTLNNPEQFLLAGLELPNLQIMERTTRVSQWAAGTASTASTRTIHFVHEFPKMSGSWLELRYGGLNRKSIAVAHFWLSWGCTSGPWYYQRDIRLICLL